MTLIERIDSALSKADDEDVRVLTYVRSQITVEGVAKRPAEDKGVSHLTQVAKDILRKYEPKEDTV